MTLPDSVRDAVGLALTAWAAAPVRIDGHRPLSGGCIFAAARLDTSAGPVFVKWGQDGHFSAEARQLAALASSATSLAVAEPIASRDPAPGAPGYLLARFVGPGRRGPGFDEALGRGLAALHQTTAPAFGFPETTWCGTTPQPNPWEGDWIAFFRDHRLGHQLRLLANSGRLDRSAKTAFERLLDQLGERLDGSEPPSLLHGDLWSGNLLVAEDGRPALIDPAAYYGHREAEFGMMTFFGGFSDRVYAAYEEAWPLPPGWRERNEIYRLWHVANHATLFGGGYVADTAAIVRRLAG